MKLQAGLLKRVGQVVVAANLSVMSCWGWTSIKPQCSEKAKLSSDVLDADPGVMRQWQQLELSLAKA